jgi:hypothetical protein
MGVEKQIDLPRGLGYNGRQQEGTMRRVRLIHWKADEADECVE